MCEGALLLSEYSVSDGNLAIRSKRNSVDHPVVMDDTMVEKEGPWWH